MGGNREVNFGVHNKQTTYIFEYLFTHEINSVLMASDFFEVG